MQAWLVLSLLWGTVERGEVEFRPSALEREVPEPFRLEPATFSFEKRLIRVTPRYRVWSVTFPSPIVTGDPTNDRVWGDYFEPIDSAEEKIQRHPGAVLSHILGSDFALSRYLAARLADRGVGVLFIRLPYYGERRRPGEARRFLSMDIERSTRSMRQGICDLRRAAAWLASRSEIDPERIGATGISLGGIVAGVTAAVDPRIGRAATVLAGGDLAEILWNMPEPESKRAREAFQAAGKTRADLESLTRPFDPLTYAHLLKGKRVLMIAGTADEVIPPRCARAFWAAAGKPTIHWIDCGHYSATGYLLPAVRETAAFFADGR